MIWGWVLFAAVIVSALVVDLVFLNPSGKAQRIRLALISSCFWVGLALLFNLLVFYWKGRGTGLEFLTAYLVEESLSIDNLFVFLLIFSYFSVPAHYQHKILFWGIVGVIIMRGIFIFAGVALIERFHWVIYVFGAFLVFTGVKLAFEKDKKVDPERNPALRLFRRFMPVSREFDGAKFFTKKTGALMATPLLVVLIVIETTDVIFAVDSIPAVFGITLDPFVIYTSNIFAVLGLRSIYFALSGLMGLFHHLHYGLSIVLAFVGVKMLISGFWKMPVAIALGAIAGILALAVIASIIWPEEKVLTGDK